MIVDKKNIELFLYSFKKSFKSFCQKLPLFLKAPIITDKEVILYKFSYDPDQKKYNEEKILNYELDFTQNIKTNIYRIKQILIEKYFPMMKEIKEIEIEASTEEISELLRDSKITLKEVTYTGYRKKQIVNWRIEKIITLQDELVVRNMNTNDVFVFKLKMPSTAALSKITEENNLEKRWDFFNSKIKSKFLISKTNNNGRD